MEQQEYNNFKLHSAFKDFLVLNNLSSENSYEHSNIKIGLEIDDYEPFVLVQAKHVFSEQQFEDLIFETNKLSESEEVK